MANNAIQILSLMGEIFDRAKLSSIKEARSRRSQFREVFDDRLPAITVARTTSSGLTSCCHFCSLS